MPTISADPLQFAQLDATVWEDSRYAYVKHEYYGWQKGPQMQYVWKRTYKPIGQGGFGAVFREECIEGSSKGALRAVKSIQKPTSVDSKSFDYSRELVAIARFSKPEYARFFVQSPGWYEDADAVFVVMELVAHGNLQQYVGSGLPEDEVKWLVVQILQGLDYMHQAGYTHRDLKPPNLLVVQRGPAWHIKIADFGVSKGIAEHLSSLRTVAGTPGYTAPEVMGLLRDDDSSDSDGSEAASRPSYNNAVDIWAVGAISFVLLTGELPFPSQNMRSLGRYVNGKVAFPLGKLEAKNVSVRGRQQIESFMAPNPSSRPGAGTALKQDWTKVAAECLPSGVSTTSSGAIQLSPPGSTASAKSTDVADSEHVEMDKVLLSPCKKNVLKGDIGDIVLALAFSPNGLLLAGCSSDGNLMLWDLTGTELFAANYSDNAVMSLAFSSSNERLILVDAGGTVREVNVELEESKLLGHCCESSCSWDYHRNYTISPDGSLIAYTHFNWEFSSDEIKIRDLASDDDSLEEGHCVGGSLDVSFEVGRSHVMAKRCLRFSPDRRLLAASLNSDIWLWDIAASGVQRIIKDPRHVLWQELALSPDGQRILGVSERHTQVWNVNTGAKERDLGEPVNDSVHVAFSPNSKLVARGHGDGTVDFLDVASGTELRTLQVHAMLISALAYSRNGSQIASAAYDGELRLWDAEALPQKKNGMSSTQNTRMEVAELSLRD